MESSRPATVGSLVISEDVIASIALNAAKDINGVSGFASRPGDVKGIFRVRDTSLKSVSVCTKDNEIQLHLYIRLKNGVKIPAVCEEVQSVVKNAVQGMTGRMVSSVDISIVGIDFSNRTEKDN